ncbi:tubulin polyglutamylase complex subunit 1 [Amia ocellicauda]|uniref:tubulin polyglutamylase complex subunit 1 n=1 Tax=Amia ocellicauda TaxID=2972642 RepID=UPI0034647203|nr:TPGS1 polyglutamylase [Amia calva]
MAEKRRAGVVVVVPDSKPPKADTEREFLSQAGVGVLLRSALLKLLEARSEDPVGFLADHFANLAQGAEDAGRGNGVQQAVPAERQQLARALWHLSLAHHSQRSAFNNNVRLAYDLLAQGAGTGGGRRRRGGGGVRGRLYTELLRRLCREGGVSESTAAPLLDRIQCQDHEAVPFDLFRQGVLTCAVFADYVRKSGSLYAAVAGGGSGSRAERALCQAVLEALRDALHTSHSAVDAARFLEASAKIAPCRLAEALALAQASADTPPGPPMEPQEFQDQAAALFIARVRTVA